MFAGLHEHPVRKNGLMYRFYLIVDIVLMVEFLFY